MITLGIDTSNYAASIAITNFTNKTVLLQDKQFLNVEQGQTGLRQQDAVFNHIKLLTNMLELVQNEFDFRSVQAIGVSTKPTNNENSYMPCFLVGKLVATAMATSLNVPLIQTSHQYGHLNSALFYLNNDDLYKQRVIIFHVSGGTTEILLVENSKILETIGSSKDLFAGQAVDRLGVKLGFSFPAGEQLSSLAENCVEDIKPKVSVIGTSCNLSGLENQCDKLLKDGKETSYVAKYCLSFIAYTILKVAQNARISYGDLPVVFSGGVMSSQVIKQIVTKNLEKSYFVPPKFSQDNGIGVAAVAAREALYD